MLHLLLTTLLPTLAQGPASPTTALRAPSSVPGGRTPLALVPAQEAVEPVDASTLELNAGTLTVADFLGLVTPASGGSSPLAGPGAGRGLRPGSGAGHPLGREDMVLSRLGEAALFMPSYAAPAGISWVREDFKVGQGIFPGTSTSSSALGQIRDAAAGNIDDDAEEEFVLLQQLAGSSLVRLVRVDRVGGSFVWTLLAELSGGTFGADDGRIVLGDFDGDQRDEIAVTLSDFALGTAGQRSWLRVYDDPEEGLGEMLFSDHPESHTGLWPEAADLDGDGVDELVLVREGDSTNAGTVRVRAFHCGAGQSVFPASQPQADWAVLSDGGTPVGAKLAIGNFDFDAAEEVVLVFMQDASSPFTPDAPSSLRLRPFQYDDGVWNTSGSSFTYASTSVGSPLRGNSWDVATVDRFARGRDEIAILRGSPGGNLRLDFFELVQDTWVSTTPVTLTIGRAALAGSGMCLAVGDGDGDGTEDLYFAALEGTAASRPLVYGNLKGGNGQLPVLYSIQNQSVSGTSHAPVLAAGDYDGDGLRVRFTGNQELSVSDPIPLVLLTAAPTKAGIAQNYGSSETSYSVGSGSGQAMGVSVGVAASVSAGVQVEAFNGLLGVTAKATMESAFQLTHTVASTTTFVQGFTGSADADVIVFQGALFRSSEYEILASPNDPTQTSTRFWIDVPVGTNTYKWTVDYYNPRVRSAYQLNGALLPHTVGDPRTYRTRNQTQSLVSSYVGWMHPARTAVGQGSGSNQLGIELANESTTEGQLEVSLSLEAEVLIAGRTFGAGITLSTGAMYSISTSQMTVYEGSVGDIAAADYPTWSYDFGFAVYQHGRTADPLNQPTGWLPGAYPLTVVTFWTDPTGSGY